jgi:hypothetical protein
MDAFCAFHPNRVMFPVLPLRLKWPEMPNDAFCWAWAAKSLWRDWSERPSANPSPNVGGGIRKVTLFSATAAPKFGCAKTQPGASDRPCIEKRSCTPPSGVPSGLSAKRASRIGPFAVMNDGIAFVAPIAFASVTCGFVAGLEPPTAGNMWQLPHELIEARTQPHRNRLDNLEAGLGRGKKSLLVRIKTTYRAAGAGRSPSHAGINHSRGLTAPLEGW